VDVTAEWGGVVRVRKLSGAERDDMEDLIAKRKVDGTVRGVMASLVSMCWVDADGNRVQPDPEKLNELNADGLSRVFAACQRINAVTQRDVEELAKN
jgi:hypothetical protein